MAIKKQFYGHGDPLLLAINANLRKAMGEDMTELSEKAVVKETNAGEQCVYHKVNAGDALFDEFERYHEAVHRRNKPCELLEENLMQLKRRKEDSLYSSLSGALYDPILQEYVLPTGMTEMKALEQDAARKRLLFREMSTRKRKNLLQCEIYCDPLVTSYRVTALMFTRGAKIPVKGEEVTRTKYGKLFQGDPLLDAVVDYEEKKVAPIPTETCKYRKVFHGDPLLNSSDLYHRCMRRKSAVPTVYRKINACDELLRAVME